MPFDDAIKAAAEQQGVQQQYWDIFGKHHTTPRDTNIAILSALGFDCSSGESLHNSVTRRDAAEWRRLLPPVLVVSESEPVRIPVRSPETLDSLDLEIRHENGDVCHTILDLTRSPVESETVMEGARFIERSVELPSKLTLGYHEVRTGGGAMRLIVTPDCAYRPPAGRHAGLGITLYGLRSRRNWGAGDFRDLRDLIDWAAPALRVQFIALNPLHAIHNRTPYNASPYLPNSIFYRNFLYLDVEAVPGYESIRDRFLDSAALAEIERLRGTEFVEYEKVAALKRRALDLIFETHPPSQECLAWIASEGDLLRLFATYCALDEHLHAQNPNLWVWPDWPESYRNPASTEVREFARNHEREIVFHGWLQWLIDQQIARVQKHALEAGMSIGLYHDLALATDRCGSDLWGYRDFFVNGARVGSPPDAFSPAGQDWSFPPPSQARHIEDGYRLYTESIRKSMRHGGALRIDHVMRLFRLYWIPEGHDATRGAYVKDRAADLVRILALESRRNKSFIVGEDLGTVETEVRRTLADFGILSYRLLIFERKNGRFKLPQEYPEQALASTSTHDLPTIEGFWRGEDIEARLRAGAVNRQSYETQKAERVRDRQQLLDALFTENLLPHNYERDAGRIPDLTPELHNAIAGYLARTPAVLWLVNQEDLTREPHQQNLPGTTAEYPNWQRKMRWSVEDLSNCREAQDCAAMIRNWLDRSGRTPHL